MRNIILLVCVFLGIVFWVYQFILEPDNLESNTKQTTDVEALTYDDTKVDVDKLSSVLGVEYHRIENEKTEQTSLFVDVELTLVSIYISGEESKVRLRVKSPSEEQYIDIAQGEKFSSLTLSKVMPSYVEIVNDEQTKLLKMYRPIIVHLANKADVKEVIK